METVICESCGRPFQPADPEEAVCPDCGPLYEGEE